MRIRLLVDVFGHIEVQASPLMAAAPAPLSFRLAPEPVDSSDVFLFHKTTRRAVYEKSAAEVGGEALLYNERGELTEFCIGNVVLNMAEGAFTPPVDSGLLAGTFRAELLERGEITERVLKKEDLARAESIYLINSVRRWIAAELI
jgi:para-aminobenzoate synthetase/4-amino-4-deoxychorismate lyase